MPLRLPPKASSKREPASFILEALITAVTATLTLAVIAPMFARQLELVRRARDLQQLDEIVMKDINAHRQYSRYWKQISGPYSDSVINNSVSAFSGTTRSFDSNSANVYVPSSSHCLPAGQFNNPMVFAYSTDTGAMGPLGGEILPDSKLETSNYKILRSFQYNQLKEEGSNVTIGLPFLRITYKAEPKGTAADLTYVRTAEIQIQAQNWC